MARARIASAEFADVQKSPIGDSNCSQAFSLLIAEGINIIEADVGENGYRKVSFDPHSGKARSVFFDVNSQCNNVLQQYCAK